MLDEIPIYDYLLSYRLGSSAATVELQRADTPKIHIDFYVFRLVADVVNNSGKAIILTGTAGDGKTYLAYRIVDRLGLDREQVKAAQRSSGYNQDGFYIDLDLSAGALTEERIRSLYRALARPQILTLVCANEGKLSELETALSQRGLNLPENVFQINLSQRALVSTSAWKKVLSGVLNGGIWEFADQTDDSTISWNRNWLKDPAVADRLRRFLLLPYLLGEPITVRETLSFLAYALGGGLSSAAASELGVDDRIRYLLFNTIFGEPEGYAHGGRSMPAEKLLWWTYRFDPADQASPQMDLRLLVELDRLDVAPPTELVDIWRNDLLVLESEDNDLPYRSRLERYMRYARRWYCLASENGFKAYFPFRYFSNFLEALSSTGEQLQQQIKPILRGLNMLLSGGNVDEDMELRIYYLKPEGARQQAAIYTTNVSVDIADLALQPDNVTENYGSGNGKNYLELMPRRLYLTFADQPEVRLPISLMLYEVLMSAGSPEGGFPATLWAKERDTVARFMNRLSQAVEKQKSIIEVSIVRGEEDILQLRHQPAHHRLKVS
jgi:hypothetical protein